MSNMEAFDESCRAAVSYPLNLIAPNTPRLELESIQYELQHQAPRVFCNENSLSVDFLEIGVRREGLCQTAVTAILVAPLKD